ncbi:MAG: 1,4-alpha-glucan-branching protein [Pedosphaera sp.]|nr:1,4-alpha-glucan-branching protein [Pedosphaera sp.]
MWLDESHVDGFRWDTPGTMLYDGNTYISDAATLITNITTMVHGNYPGRINIAEDVLGMGFDSTWDTTYPYVLTPILANTVDANRDMNLLANALTTNQRFGSAAGFNRVVFLESHDVVGDLNNGVRLPAAIDGAAPNSYRARKLSTLGATLTFTAPGVPMIFEGQEMLENQQFSDSRTVDWTKTNTYSAIVTFYHDLIHLRRNLAGDVPGLKGSQISLLQVDNVNKLVAYYRRAAGTSGQDVVVVANFANAVRTNYSLPFPATGNWRVHFNSDSTNYSADYGNVGSTLVTASGANPAGNITIGPYSALILSQMPFPPPLSITQSNNTVIISWPNSLTNWVLDVSDTLAGNPPPWSQVPAAQYQTNNASIFIGLTPPTGNSFYRLRQL